MVPTPRPRLEHDAQFAHPPSPKGAYAYWPVGVRPATVGHVQISELTVGCSSARGCADLRYAGPQLCERSVRAFCAGSANPDRQLWRGGLHGRGSEGQAVLFLCSRLAALGLVDSPKKDWAAGGSPSSPPRRGCWTFMRLPQMFECVRDDLVVVEVSTPADECIDGFGAEASSGPF